MQNSCVKERLNAAGEIGLDNIIKTDDRLLDNFFTDNISMIIVSMITLPWATIPLTAPYQLELFMFQVHTSGSPA